VAGRRKRIPWRGEDFSDRCGCRGWRYRGRRSQCVLQPEDDGEFQRRKIRRKPMESGEFEDLAIFSVREVEAEIDAGRPSTQSFALVVLEGE